MISGTSVLASVPSRRLPALRAAAVGNWSGIEEDVLSGKSLKRPACKGRSKPCRAGEVAGVVVAKLDRLSRSLTDFAGRLEDARRHRYNVVTLNLGIDLSTPAGEMFANAMATFAHYEWQLIGVRTKEALAVKKPGRHARTPALDPG